MRRLRSTRRNRRPRRRRHAPLARRILRAVLLALGLLVAFLLLLILLLRWVDPPYSMYMLSPASGPSAPSLRHTWQPIHELPLHVPLAVIAAEDQRFPQHRGFDWQSMREALNAHRQGARLRGASTVSQQTAKNVFLWHGRSLTRKLLEAGFTAAIETLWPKGRILEVYLNVAEWGPGIFGIEAAAQYHFGIPARQLSPEQAALLAAVLPSPRTYSPSRPSGNVLQRARWIERQMAQLGPGWLAPLQVGSGSAPTVRADRP
ncbi:MAG: monofunctional biosynthetic peptidoglycan transglycosylase [Thioalkalivibrio sp.]|nr:MAG: monofunctional biosynthetic peptidoglycan transglycosylase [Thioalkalivibrio sp.]